MHDIQKRIMAAAQDHDLSGLGLRKIGQLVDEQHPQKIKYHLQKLFDKGYLIRDRSGKITTSNPGDSTGKMIRVPVLGAANCGQALLYANENIEEYLQVSPRVAKRFDSIFAVRAVGDSMNEANIEGHNIEDGDYVLVDGSKQEPKDGDYVLSTTEGLANIKRFYRDLLNNCVMLVSQSTNKYPPILLDETDVESYYIHGTIAQVVKMPKL